MTMLIDENTKVIVHGITGTTGSLHTKSMLDYGTKIVAGIRPGAEGQEVHGVKVYNTTKDAVEKTGGNTSILFVPPKFAKDSAIEAINAGVKLIVIVPEHLPQQDAIEILEHAKKKGARVVGPNTAGIISPIHKCKIGFVPDKFFTKGNIVIASRSGTLMYEMASRLNEKKIGQSFCIGVGGDPIIGMRFAEVLQMAQNDPDTKAVILIGEIGGTQEEEAADLVAKGEVTKPVFAYIAGRFAPKDKTMGHAGALVSGGKGTMDSKLHAFENAKIKVGQTPQDVVDFVNAELQNNI